MSTEQITTKPTLGAFAKIATKTITFSVAALSFLTQDTVGYADPSDQLWRFQQHPIPSDINTPNYEIKNAAVRSGDPDLCLGVVGADDRPPRLGAEVEVFECGTDLNAADRRRDQLWRLDQVRDQAIGVYRIVNFVTPRGRSDGNLCLGIVGLNRPVSGSRAEIYHCNPRSDDSLIDNQWVTGNIGARNVIKSRANQSLCLEAIGSARSGAKVAIFPCR